MKLRFVICFLFCPLVLKADFIAFRKLTHPQTKKVVYLLYDVHGSLVGNHSLGKKLSNELDDIVTNAVIKDREIGIDRFTFYDEVFENIFKQASLIRNNLPHLIRQHNDLADIVKKHHISLIDEDWIDPEEKKFDFPFGGIAVGKMENFILRLIGKQEQYKRHLFRIGVSPMLGMSKKLTGKFTSRKLIHIHNNAYFFNPDTRNGSIGEEAVRSVDRLTLKAIDELFIKYNQSAVIVAEGANHIVHIEDELIKKGYVSGNIIISKGLAQERSKSQAIDEYLNALENRDAKKEDAMNFDDESTYKIIAHPINLKAIFSEELKR